MLANFEKKFKKLFEENESNIKKSEINDDVISLNQKLILISEKLKELIVLQKPEKIEMDTT